MYDAFKYGFLNGLRQWRIVGIVYFFQLCLAVTIGLQVMEVFNASIGNSLEINKLLHNYDHTVISDFLKVHGASITPLIGQMRWLLLTYLIFAVFIDAGLLICAVKSEAATGLTFWQGSAKYFFSFLKIALVFLILVVIWSALIFIPLLLNLQPALENFPNEKYAVWGTLSVLLIYFLGLIGLFLWSVSSRIWKINSGSTIFASLQYGGKILWKNKSRCWGLLGLFFILQVCLVALYWLLDAFAGMTSPVLIVMMVLVQQVFSFFRVILRVMCYAGLGRVFKVSLEN